MAKVVVVATIHRCGQKIYPVIDELSKRHDVSVLLHNEMRRQYSWQGEKDPRQSLYAHWESLGVPVIPDSRRATFDGVNLVLFDDNFCKGSLGIPDVAKKAKSQGATTVGCPHGNHEFARMRKFLNLDILDYSFVFGHKEQKLMFDGKYQGRLIPGGVPANDALGGMNFQSEHILVVPSYLPTQNSQKKNKNGYLPFTEKTLIRSGLLDLQQKFGLPIIIKEKVRSKENLKKALAHLSKYEGVSVIMDCDDLNELVAKSAVVVGAPSTLCFKSIQKGIPTILLRQYGMTGNFYDYAGLKDLNAREIVLEVERQQRDGRDEDFIRQTLEGGIDFSSSNIYLNNLERIIKKERV